ncbi:GDSL esterase/lipase [Zea mays]|uniref:GDSL esterase/lipase n=1 Tax=Zea mays TaxID=4577 RepID=A0A3L6DJC0_MAIZE|nr:GDSL esterase/lipase [Zea mays]
MQAAEALGVPLLPPFLSSRQPPQDMSRGANFAIVGGTALDVGFFLRRNAASVPPFRSSLRVQIGWFRRLKKRLLCNANATAPTRSLFVVGELGSNDYAYILAGGKSLREAKSFVPEVVKAICTGIERLVEEGARYVVVSGTLPAGCLPMALTKYGAEEKQLQAGTRGKNATEYYDRRTGCLRRLNGLAEYHNWMLREAVGRLRRKYPTTKLVFADFYRPVARLLRRPAKFGFTEEPIRACCGGGGPYNYNPGAACGSPGATVCRDPSAHVHWDGIHLTEAAYKYIADGWLSGLYAYPPSWTFCNSLIQILFHSSTVSE